MGFLDLFNVIDSDGVSAARYRLHFLGSALGHTESWIFGMLTELVYMLFQVVAVLANSLLGAVLNSSSWLDMLGGLYQKLTAPLFAVFPPWSVACVALALVAFSEFRTRVQEFHKTKTLDRMSGALAMTATVLVLTHDPFSLMAKLLELANGFSVGLAGAVTRGGPGHGTLTNGQALVDASIRTPTIALNYGTGMSASCTTQWSQAMQESRALAESSGCYSSNANEATPGSLGTAVLMLILPAVPMLVFAGIAAWKYFAHLTQSVWWLMSTGWVAAINIYGKHGFEKLVVVFAKCGAHLLMAVITSMLAVALPSAVAGLGMEVLNHWVTNPQAQAFGLMVALGVGFAVSAWAIVQVTGKNHLLVRALHADLEPGLDSLLNPDKKTKFTFTNMGAWLKDGKEPPKNDKLPSPIAGDPVAATAPSDPPPGSGAGSGSEGSGAGASSGGGVDQLMVAAAPPASATSNAAGAHVGSPGSARGASPVGSPGTGVVVVGTGGTIPAGAINLATAVSVNVSPVAVIVVGGGQRPRRSSEDRYGYYTRPENTGPEVLDAEFWDLDEYSELPAGTSSGSPGSSASPSPSGDNPGGGGSGGGGIRSVLADSARPALSAGNAEPAEPLRLALPAGASVPEATDLNTPVEVVGTVGAPPAEERAPRMTSPLQGRFDADAGLGAAPPRGVPDVAQGSPLAPLTSAPVPGPELAGADPDAAAQITDAEQNSPRGAQQQWDTGYRAADVSGARGDSPDDPDGPSAAPVKPRPGGTPGGGSGGAHLAPPMDFVAGDEQRSQERMARYLAAADPDAGVVVFAINLDNPHGGLDLSSNPDRRVVEGSGSGLGDPV